MNGRRRRVANTLENCEAGRSFASIQSDGCDHDKLGDIYFDSSPVDNTLHEIFSDHLADTGFQVTPGNVLMALTWLENRLLANNAFTLHFALIESGIENMPVTAQQLNGEIAMILDRYPVRKHVMVLARTGVRRLILRLHAYLYPLGDFSYHCFKSKNFLEFLAIGASFRWKFPVKENNHRIMWLKCRSNSWLRLD